MINKREKCFLESYEVFRAKKNQKQLNTYLSINSKNLKNLKRWINRIEENKDALNQEQIKRLSFVCALAINCFCSSKGIKRGFSKEKFNFE